MYLYESPSSRYFARRNSSEPLTYDANYAWPVIDLTLPYRAPDVQQPASNDSRITFDEWVSFEEWGSFESDD